MKLEKRIQRITREMDKLALDVSEIKIAVDADYQADRLYSLSKQLKQIVRDMNPSTEIHGGGTGDD